MDVYRSDPRVINETVQAARDFLTAELDRYESWEEVENESAHVSTLILKLSQNSDGGGKMNPPKWVFGNLKSRGIGRAAISAFLGDNWNKSMVERSLVIINDSEIDRTAAEKFPTMGQAIVFRETVKKYEVLT